MQIREQILHVLCVQRLTISGHLISAEADDVDDALIVGGQSAQRKIFVLENALQGWSLFAAVGIRLMTAVAV
jgi:hypothetical protein